MSGCRLQIRSKLEFPAPKIIYGNKAAKAFVVVDRIGQHLIIFDGIFHNLDDDPMGGEIIPFEQIFQKGPVVFPVDDVWGETFKKSQLRSSSRLRKLCR